MFNIIDLFAGAGGLSYGFLQTKKYKIKLAIEQNSSAQQTYLRNHPSVEMWQDINSFDDFERFEGKVELIIGGPPCQGFSNANRQKFKFISDNNNLVKKYVEFILKLKPKAFLLENVSMFQSPTHRFYISPEENLDVLRPYFKIEEIDLYEGEFLLDAKKLLEIANQPELSTYLLPERLIRDLNLILNRQKHKSNFEKFRKKQGKVIISRLNNELKNANHGELAYQVLQGEAIKIAIQLLEDNDFSREKEKILMDFINIQKFFQVVYEINKNNIIHEEMKLVSNKITVRLQSITVRDYLRKHLGQYYHIEEEVLNAADYGVPQSRRRFIAIGVVKELHKPDYSLFPKPISNSCLTVADAIEDLEDIPAQYYVKDLPYELEGKLEHDEKNPLAGLRNSKTIYNHIITKSEPSTLERFEALKQGQNFHDLDRGITTTYTNPEKTQNSIYRRLDYSQSSPTVINVRKSMWVHPTRNRAISIREAARLQTFDDKFKFMGSKDEQYQQVGNAVPPVLAYHLAEYLYNYLKSHDKLLVKCGCASEKIPSVT